MMRYFRSNHKRKNAWAIFACLLGVILSCDDFVLVPAPGTELVQDNVFKDDATALAALAGVYIKLADGNTFANGEFYSVTIFEGINADELISFPSSSSSPSLEFYLNNVTPKNGIVYSTWTDCYKIIYECNRILEGLNQSNTINHTQKDQLYGEALFIRAFSHFYLVNLFGDVPLIISSDYQMNAKVSRTPSVKVYEQIIKDLLDAKALLSDSYPSAGRVRVNKGAATAMLARAYLYAGDFINAEVQATALIGNTSQYQLMPDLNAVFLKTSEEAILQLLPEGGAQKYTNEGKLFVLMGPPTGANYALRDELYAAFEIGDLRKTEWVDSLTSSSGFTTWYYAHKYKETSLNGTGAEYSMVLRLAEQYLIRAEARARQNNLTGSNSAETDINAIRNRAGLPDTSAATLDEMLVAIEQERRVELFTEWGHRFFDLKRTGRLDAVLSPVKPNWDSNDALLPLPQNELLINPNLKPQNPGY